MKTLYGSKIVFAMFLCLIFLFGKINSQNPASDKSVKTKEKSDLTTEQKNFVSNFWFESPNEASENTIVFRLNAFPVPLTEVNPPRLGQLNLLNKDNFECRFLKGCEPSQTGVDAKGTWDLTRTSIRLDFGKEKYEYSIVEVEKDKLVLTLKK